MATPATARIRRKPAPAVDADALLLAEDAARAGGARHSFALYAAPPLSPAPAPAAPHSPAPFPIPSAAFSPSQPHYTRRRAQSAIPPSPSVPAPTTPTRTRIARLLLPHPLPTRVRKHTISSPAPVAFSPGLLPPALAAAALALPRASSSSADSADTAATSPPASPTSQRKLVKQHGTAHKPSMAALKTKLPPLPALMAPSAAARARAARLPLVAPSGVRVPFGALLGMPDDSLGMGERRRRALVVFLRHLWCPLCQDYVVVLSGAMRAVASPSVGRARVWRARVRFQFGAAWVWGLGIGPPRARKRRLGRGAQAREEGVEHGKRGSNIHRAASPGFLALSFKLFFSVLCFFALYLPP
ncbi:hypothetical protein DFH09DRAFT_1367671 [Mycena vulgaris]|nr:hypothetical protein DFH09DRAFT_1367671 [Mycena vulgaris]